MTRKRHFLGGFAVLTSALLLSGGALAAPSRTTQSSLLQAVNATRAAYGLRALSPDPALTRAARAHSLEMLRGGTFAHGDFQGRMNAFHVRATYVGENLAWGSGPYGTATAVVREWLASPEHRANLLRPSFTRIGIGTTQGSFLGTGGATVVTADFSGS